MENAVNALKIGFSVLVLITALSILLSLISEINKTSEIVLYNADKTNFYNYKTAENSSKRLVTEAEIISALTNQEKEKVHIYIRQGQDVYTRSKDGTINGQKLEEFVYDKLSQKNIYDEEIIEVNITGSYWFDNLTGKVVDDESKVILAKRKH